jgi:protein-tyrosine phosphatase
MKSYSIMFICSGNICRSPLAHGVFEHLVKDDRLKKYLEVESSGTGAYHVGEQADSRMRQTASSHGVRLNHRSRQLIQQDFVDYDLLLTMDSHNYRDAKDLCRSGEERSKIRMFRDYDPEGRGDVPDPWYGGLEGFEDVWTIVHRTCLSLLEKIRKELAA